MSQPSYTGFNVKGIDLLNYYQYLTGGPTGSTETGFFMKGASGFVDIGSIFSPYVSGVTGTAPGYYNKKGGIDINTLFLPIMTPTNISTLYMYSGVNNIYIVDTGNNRIQFIPLTSGTYFGQTMKANFVYTIGGLAVGTAGLGTNGQSVTSSELSSPTGIYIDSPGNIYIADTNNNRIQFVPITAGTYFGQVMTANNVYTIAGLATGIGGLGASGSATSSALSSPNGVYVDSTGNVYISDSGNNRIQFIPVSSGTYFGIAMTANWIYTRAGLAGGNTLTVGTFNANPGGLPANSNYSAVAVSSTGQYQLACINGGSAYLSTNYGQSFIANPTGLLTSAAHSAVSISSTGQYMLTCTNSIELSTPTTVITQQTGPINAITTLLSGTPLATQMELVFRGSTHGHNAAAFHARCNGKAPLFFIIKATTGYIATVFVNVPFNNSSFFSESFVTAVSGTCWLNPLQDSVGRLSTFKAFNTVYPQNTVYDVGSYGPSFGASDLYIPDNWLSTSGSTVPHSYSGLTSTVQLLGSGWRISEMEIYTTTSNTSNTISNVISAGTIFPPISSQSTVISNYGGTTYLSSNYGSSFNAVIPSSSSTNFKNVSISSTGQYMMACIYNGGVYISSNYGNSFTANPTGLSSSATYYSTAISSTGQYMLTCNNNTIGGTTTVSVNTALVAPTISGAGASTSTVGSYTLYTFTRVGTSTVTFSQGVIIGYLVVAGGAGGIEGGGGSGGGVSYSTYANGYTVSANTPITITVGGGGAGAGSAYAASQGYWPGDGGISRIAYTDKTISATGGAGPRTGGDVKPGGTGSGGNVNLSGGASAWCAPGNNGPLVTISDIGINSYYGGAGGGFTGAGGLGGGGNGAPYSGASPSDATFYGGGGGGGWTNGASGYQGIVYLYTITTQTVTSTFPIYTGGSTYISSNYGLSFNTVIPASSSTNFTSVSLSSTGQYQLACANPGGIYISTNFGRTFTLNNSGAPTSTSYSSVSVSSSGQYMLAAVTGGSVYLSMNYGTSFTSNPGSLSTGNYSAVAISQTGQYMLTCINGGSTYLSKSNGLTGTNGQLTTNSALNVPRGIFTDSNKNIYIADTYNNRIQFIPQTSGTYFTQAMIANYVYTIAGLAAGTPGLGTNGQIATSSALSLPNGIYVDSTQNIYIADTGNNRIQFIPITSGTYFTSIMTANYVYTIAGLSTGLSGLGATGQTATTSALNAPTTLYIDSANNIYISDTGNNRTQFLPRTTGTYFGQSMTANLLYTIAGLAAGTAGIGTNNQLATNSALNGETGLFVTNYSLLKSSNVQLSFTLSVPTTTSSTYTFKYYINQRVTGYIISAVTFIGSTIIVNIPSTHIVLNSTNTIYVSVTNTFGESLLVGAPSISLYFDSNGTYIPPPGQPVLSGVITQTANTTNYTANFTVTGNFTSISWSLTNASLSSTFTGSTTSTVSPVSVPFNLSSGSVYYNTSYMLTIYSTGPGGTSTTNGSYTLTTPPATPPLGTITSTSTTISIPFTVSTGATSYSAYYYSGATPSFVSSTLFSSTITSSPVVITGLTSNTTYYVFLVAVSSYGSSPVAISGQILTAPVAPTNVTTTGSGNYSIDFSFTPSTGATTYSAYYNTSNSFATATKYTPSSAITSSPASIAGLNSSTTYYIFLVANSANGSSTHASGGSATTATPYVAPSPPPAPIVGAYKNGGNSVTVYIINGYGAVSFYFNFGYGSGWTTSSSFTFNNIPNGYYQAVAYSSYDNGGTASAQGQGPAFSVP